MVGPALDEGPADPVEVGRGEADQVGVAEQEGVGVARRHPRLQGVGLGAARAGAGSRRTTLAPAAAARSAVPSVDPSSTTSTSRM